MKRNDTAYLGRTVGPYLKSMRHLLYSDVPGVQLRFGETNFQENRITGAAMRIFIQPRTGDSFERVIERTIEIFTDAQTLSAHYGRCA